MYTFRDFYHNEVKLSFQTEPFSNRPKHVWVICRCNGQWLLTKHKERGLEFPGGKVENGETAKEAAIREVHEETGGIVEDISYIGQYFVAGKGGDVIKNVYFATVERLTEQETYFETDGPVLLSGLPKDIRKNKNYSFIMKDDVLVQCMQHIQKLI
ncbi:RNA deprotection pyrophosphohydrolase [Virgibacillus halophilus]|uniref:Nucleoside triphosphatase YtkD n=1 Tax=Tigheibacillus halophilus TaxID=361280 RepID=A0ABU5C1G6_9BACI|nr:nucleoside triphosphatase YtkD [Virgibacillus halophilus]